MYRSAATNHRLTEALHNALFLAEDRLIQRIPPVGGGHARLDLIDNATTAIRVRHDHNAVAFSDVCHQMTAESPVPSAMAEIPPLSLLLDLESHRKRAR